MNTIISDQIFLLSCNELVCLDCAQEHNHLVIDQWPQTLYESVPCRLCDSEILSNIPPSVDYSLSFDDIPF